eukprot:CAMPEP_0172525498 /NCGR_PEP_ID=MMETSP1067-20121228/534_1 /TAXON_ID=265564 ORGANISM="Thalassiosira punctigera, Strain Tpunct2005C2" /NCGR_SAMPLE_ID=MMETSP1067 /ASSEMBLY_ACC=CAM_ASM_000444 /LENGTH=73 /DNA_ID=CAMNT_0013308771 /DNA_START=82 /DNA_END=299 /DNA_ORIENTATION=-
MTTSKSHDPQTLFPHYIDTHIFTANMERWRHSRVLLNIKVSIYQQISSHVLGDDGLAHKADILTAVPIVKGHG